MILHILMYRGKYDYLSIKISYNRTDYDPVNFKINVSLPNHYYLCDGCILVIYSGYNKYGILNLITYRTLS